MRDSNNGKKKIGIPEAILFGAIGLLFLALVFAIIYLTVLKGKIGKDKTTSTETVAETAETEETDLEDELGLYEEIGTNPFTNGRTQRDDRTEADETAESGEETADTDEPIDEATLEVADEDTENSEGETEDAGDDEDADPVRDEIIDGIIDDLTVHEKVCQLFVVYPSAITGVKNVTVAGNMTKDALAKYPVGGFLYNKSNMEDKQQLTDMLTKVQYFCDIPLILTCDEEGGRVERLMSKIGTTQIGPMYDYKDQGTEKAYENAYTIASDMKSVGMNLDFAPVADVWSNPNNTVIGDRAYSDDYEQAAELIASAVKGFKEGGVACTLKHFPGHGDTVADTHYDTAVVTKTLEELRQQEFLPFKAGIDAGADAVMIGHLVVKDISDEPAVFSKEIVTDILRGELGFKGVVITDALEMGAIADNYTSGEAARKCFEAGADIILCPADFESAEKEIEDAVVRDEIDMDRLDESVRRILILKYNMGLL